MEEAAVACRFSSGCDVRYTCTMSCISIAQDVGKQDYSSVRETVNSN